MMSSSRKGGLLITLLFLIVTDYPTSDAFVLPHQHPSFLVEQQASLLSPETALFSTLERRGGGGGGSRRRDGRRKATGHKKRGGPGRGRKPNSRHFKPQKSVGGANGTKDDGAAPTIRTRRAPSHIFTNYRTNRNDIINKERKEESIGCPHFSSCDGCSVDRNVADIDVVESNKLYFSSTSIRKGRSDVVGENAIRGNVDYEDVIVEEKDDGFCQIVIPSPLCQWRSQAKLAVAPKSSSWAKDGCRFGLYKAGTHSVEDIPNCKVHHPSINKAVEALEAATKRVGTPAHREDTDGSGLRYVQFQVERMTQRVCLTLVWNCESIKNAQPSLTRLVKQLQKENNDLWHSIWCHCNDSFGNNIFIKGLHRWHRLIGPEFVREPLLDQGWFYFNPLTFRQGNMDGFDILAMDVARHIPGGGRVCELYAGVGVLGLTSLAIHHRKGTPLAWLRCSDENPANPRCFTRTLESLPPEVIGRAPKNSFKKQRGGNHRKGNEEELTIQELQQLMLSEQELPSGGVDASSSSNHKDQSKATYLVASASEALFKGQALGAEVLVVDPPRRGLEEEVVRELCKPIQRHQPYTEDPMFLAAEDKDASSRSNVNWVNDVTKLIYVSCSFDAFARDCEQLLNSPTGWRLKSATGYILFPGSDHLETVAVFERQL